MAAMFSSAPPGPVLPSNHRTNGRRVPTSRARGTSMTLRGVIEATSRDSVQGEPHETSRSQIGLGASGPDDFVDTICFCRPGLLGGLTRSPRTPESADQTPTRLDAAANVGWQARSAR